MKMTIRSDFENNGFAVIHNFLTNDEIKEIKQTVYEMVEKMDFEKEQKATDSSLNPEIENIIPAGDSIRYFFETGALDENKNLLRDKQSSLYRIGFALHCLSPAFQKLTFSDKMQKMVKNLGYTDPRVAQTMYIFKNPEVGSEFMPHQDATYLHTTGDTVKELGIWIPFEDATEENGCLWFIPGSHKTGLHRQYIRNPTQDPKFIFTKDNRNYDNKDFVSVEVKKGSAVLIDGLVVHKSPKNTSKFGRPSYVIHLYDKSVCGWDPLNWLQPTSVNPFPPLYAN